jgi:hypothetical protein
MQATPVVMWFYPSQTRFDVPRHLNLPSTFREDAKEAA